MIKFISSDCSLKDKTLLVCGISIGGVPTLALDNLITLNKFERVAYYHSDYLQPSVGYLPHNIQQGALGMPAQIYGQGDVLILQFRSVLRFGRKKDFVKEIKEFVQKYAIKDVVVLGSLPEEFEPTKEDTIHKPIYFKKQGKFSQNIAVDRCEELKLIHPFSLLQQQNPDGSSLMKYAGICEQMVKQFDNILALFVFCQDGLDKDSAQSFSKQIYKVVDRKEVSKIK